ncbi:MAG: hypothetical protein OEV21_02750 [Thermoplasmata archaeon]|nr:hypothetical protein [Thermoplasmata archaeon]
MRANSFATAVVSLLLIISLSLFPSAASQEDDWPIGKEWLYYYLDEFDQAAFIGQWRYICVGETEWSLKGTEVEVVKYISYIFTNATGTSEGMQLSGNWDLYSEEYYDVDSGYLVAYVINETMNLRAEDYLDSYEWNYSQHNVTEFLPPGGTGYEPFDLEEGTIWTKNYTQESTSVGEFNGEPFEEHSIYTEQVQYTFKGYEMITVPAGEFFCSVYESEYEDGSIQTQYYSSRAENLVKIIEYFGPDETITISLESYGEVKNTVPSTLEISPVAGVIFLSFIGATAVATVIAASIVRKKKETPPGFA